jgi:hypothetical protein
VFLLFATGIMALNSFYGIHAGAGQDRRDGKLFDCETGLPNNRAERAARHVAGMIRHSDSNLRMVRMLQLNMLPVE